MRLWLGGDSGARKPGSSLAVHLCLQQHCRVWGETLGLVFLSVLRLITRLQRVLKFLPWWVLLLAFCGATWIAARRWQPVVVVALQLVLLGSLSEAMASGANDGGQHHGWGGRLGTRGFAERVRVISPRPGGRACVRGVGGRLAGKGRSGWRWPAGRTLRRRRPWSWQDPATQGRPPEHR